MVNIVILLVAIFAGSWFVGVLTKRQKPLRSAAILAGIVVAAFFVLGLIVFINIQLMKG